MLWAYNSSRVGRRHPFTFIHGTMRSPLLGRGHGIALIRNFKELGKLFMRYGHFDSQRREYVIDNPDTPASWINYMGSDEFCSIISNNASGYSFYKSPKSGRMTRFRFNSIPTDRPGRYIYLRDEADGDYWSATWQPVAKPLAEFKSICRHGMGYTTFVSEYKGIEVRFTAFVPVGQPIEIWEVEIENKSDRVRDLSVFGYAEWCLWEMTQDLTNFQYILYVCAMSYKQDVIDYSIQLWPQPGPQAFFASILPAVSFDTDRDVFIGNYRHEGQPKAVENGECFGSVAVGGSPCAALQNRISLVPGEVKRASFVMGIGNSEEVGRPLKERFTDDAEVKAELDKVHAYWDERLSSYGCETPSEEANVMVNVWNQYQCHTTFNWSRSASFNEAGGRDGIGYRDTNQDTLGVVHAIPGAVRKKLLTLMKGQTSRGCALHHFQPLSWVQGPHNVMAEEDIYSDDHLWLLVSVPAYIRETGDWSILDEVEPYADAGEATVYGHLKQALEFSWTKRGPHGLLLGLRADWNDCLNLKGKGESIWSTQLFFRCLNDFVILANKRGEAADAARYTEMAQTMQAAIESEAWDGEWYVRGFLDSGKKLGSHESEQSKIFINSQSWSVVSGAAPRDRGIRAMDSLNKYLATKHGIVLNWPAFRKYDLEIGAATSFPPGLKENAGIFCHSNTWAIIAEAMLGRGDRAFEYYLSYLPAAYNDQADHYGMEPYVYSQFITGIEHVNKFGRARNSWLTGTASWSFVAISQFVLGVRPDFDGLIVDPSIPQAWDGFKVSRKFRGKRFDITIENPNHVSKGVVSLTVNGQKVDGNTVPLDLAGHINEVRIVLG